MVAYRWHNAWHGRRVGRIPLPLLPLTTEKVVTSKYERHTLAKNILTGVVIVALSPIWLPMIALAFLNDGLHEEETASVTLGER